MFSTDTESNGSRTNIRTRGIVCQSYSRALIESRLSSRLKRDVRVDSGRLEIGTFADFSARIDSPSSLCAYLISDRYRAAFQFSQNLAFSIVDLVMGGRGYPPVETRPLSELEQDLLGGLFQAFAEDLGRAWHQLIPYEWRVAQEAQFIYSLEGILPQEKMLIATFDVGIEDLTQGEINLAVPLAATIPLDQRIRPQEQDHPLDSPLADLIPLTLQVILPPTEITVERLLELEEGDILEFSDWELAADEEQGIEVVVAVEELPRYSGRMGVLQNRRAVEIQGDFNADDSPAMSDT